MTDSPPVTLWQSIADALRAEIAAGRYRAGDRLPTESQFALRFGVNRHTVRRALAALADEQIVHSRRGAGVFVTARPLDYPVGRRVRFGVNIRALGREPRREGTVTTRSADANEAAALEIAPGDPVHVWHGLSLVDGDPVALATSVFPAARLPDLPRHLSDGGVTQALAACGVADYLRRSTRIEAVVATPAQAAQLRLRAPAALLRATSVNVDLEGCPVEHGTTWFAGDRIALTTED